MPGILIIGGGGYIGSVLTAQLLHQGQQVKVFDRFYFGQKVVDPLPDRGQLTLIRGDVRSIEPQIFEGITAVIHLAALSNDPSCDLDPTLTEQINHHGALRVATLAKDAGVERFIFSSSCSVYGAGQDAGALTEEAPPRPVSLYAKTKLQTEQALSELQDDRFCVTVLRNATVYGLSQRMRFDLVINAMTLAAYQNRKIHIMGGGNQWRPLIHVRDLARAFIEVFEAPRDLVAGQVFNVGSDEQNFQVTQIARLVCDIVPNTVIERTPDDLDKRSYRVAFGKISEQLGFVATHEVIDGIEEIYTALRRGYIDDNIRTRTVGFYQYLIEAERLVKDLSLDGKIL